MSGQSSGEHRRTNSRRLEPSNLRMERSEEERTKYPDRINLDRRGLHGIPVLADEPGLRLLSFQHNFIKRIHNLELTSRLVFLDLYHNRLDHIAGLEPLNNLRVLMLGKNRIRKIEGLTDCPKLSVLDLHGNRIGNIAGLERLTELKVLNLAGNLIRKVNGLQNLGFIEELNLRRNRIRTTSGLESVPSLQKLYMSNNEIQGLGSLVNLETLTKLQTIQMEGNPVWSNPDYSYHLVSSLPSLTTLDQQDVTPETKGNAKRWKESKMCSRQPSPTGDNALEKSRKQLFKKLEERNASISNAKHRWDFLKTKTLPSDGDTTEENNNSRPEASGSDPDPINDNHCSGEITKSSSSGSMQKQDSRSELQIKLDVPAIPDPSKGAIPKIIKRQFSDKNLHKLGSAQSGQPALPRSSSSCSNISGLSRRSGTGSDSESTRKLPPHIPPIPIRDSAIRIKFPGLERRKFALPQRYETLNDSDESQKTYTRSNSLHDINIDKQKIGYFNVHPRKVGHGESSSTCQSDDDDVSGGGFLSDSESSSSDSSDQNEGPTGYPGHTGKRILDKNNARGRSLAKNMTSSRSSSQFSEERGPARNWTSSKAPSSIIKSNGNLFRKRGQDIGEIGGRTSEQGKDYLIELDGDLLSVYGSPSIKYLERPWNKQRAQRASTVQFNFLSFDELVPFLPKFRDNFPNVEHYEFTETNLHSMNQINALAQVQGITSLTISEEGNPIFNKNWRPYAIFRLEHWGLLYVNNQEVSDDEILAANETYGSLGELAIMALPKTQILNLFKKLELGDVTREMSVSEDFLGTIKDANVKEIIAKESLEYHPNKSCSDSVLAQRQAVSLLVELGHSVFHKFGRLQDEWVCILPIVIHRILAQYQDIQNYKKGELGKLEHSLGETSSKSS